MSDLVIACIGGAGAALCFGLAAVCQRIVAMRGADATKSAGLIMLAQLPVGIALLLWSGAAVNAHAAGWGALGATLGLAATVVMLWSLARGMVAFVAPFAGTSGLIVASWGIIDGSVPDTQVLIGLGIAACGAAMALGSVRGAPLRAAAGGITAACLFAGADLAGLAAAHASTTTTGAGLVVSIAAVFGLPLLAARKSAPSIPLAVPALTGLLLGVGLASLIVGLAADLTVAALVSAQHSLVAVVGGYVFLHEHLSRSQRLATALVLIGIAVAAAG